MPKNFANFSLEFQKPYQTLESVFHQISKHLEVVQKTLAVPRFFNLLLCVWISDETHHLVFDQEPIILLQTPVPVDNFNKYFDTMNILGVSFILYIYFPDCSKLAVFTL